jgi:hypothetical protein
VSLKNIGSRENGRETHKSAIKAFLVVLAVQTIGCVSRDNRVGKETIIGFTRNMETTHAAGNEKRAKRRNGDSSHGSDSTKALAEAAQPDVRKKRNTRSSSSSMDGGAEDAGMGSDAGSVPVDVSLEGIDQQNANTMDSIEKMTEYLKNLPGLPRSVPQLRKLQKNEIEELEIILEFRGNPGQAEDSWREDWGGNLSLVEKDIVNPQMRLNSRGVITATSGMTTMHKKSPRQSLLWWARNGPNPTLARRLMRTILQHVCTFQSHGIPPTLKKIFGGITPESSIEDIIHRIRRASYDPQVLKEDGWTVEKSAAPEGASGGAYLIGEKILSDQATAVIIAYVHDPDIGDLWKALWVDDEMLSFDLEAEELLDAKRKWDKRFKPSSTSIPPAEVALKSDGDPKSRRFTRFNDRHDFTLPGIECGIVLAASYSKGARPNVYWPARLMHASEGDGNTISGAATAKRTISKQKVEVVFLAPYWISDDQFGRQRRLELLSENGESSLKTNPLFMIETIDANDEMLKEFSFDSINLEGLDIARLRAAFRFTGLPKSVFSRFLDSHRIAMALKQYAKVHLKSSPQSLSSMDKAAAGLFESHPIALQVPSFPSVILHLPFSYILSKLPRAYLDTSTGSSVAIESRAMEPSVEPILNLDGMIKAMIPPNCFNDANAQTVTAISPNAATTLVKPQPSDFVQAPTQALWISGATTAGEDVDDERASAIMSFMMEFPLLNESLNRFYSSPTLVGVLSCLTRLLSQIGEEDEEMTIRALTISERQGKLRSLITSWSILKRLGEDSLAALLSSDARPVLVEWCRCAEKIYLFMVAMFADGKTVGNGLTTVITDTRCNSHRTSGGCFERPVRLPAALKGAKLAGAGRDEMTRLITSVPVQYLDYVEKKLLAKAHDMSYLKRMKSKCAAARTDDEVLVLTDNSDGEGGEDTSKCEFC